MFETLKPLSARVIGKWIFQRKWLTSIVRKHSNSVGITEPSDQWGETGPSEMSGIQICGFSTDVLQAVLHDLGHTLVAEVRSREQRIVAADWSPTADDWSPTADAR